MTYPITAWQRIARAIADQITSGQTPVGAKIASHQQLIGLHGTSLGTVKRALDYLQEAGILQGVQGSGVFVQRLPNDKDLNFKTTTTPDGNLTELREEVADLRDQMATFDETSSERLAQLTQSLASLQNSDTDLRTTVGVLQAHLIELYARLGQPYPGATNEQQPSQRTTRRLTADG